MNFYDTKQTLINRLVDVKKVKSHRISDIDAEFREAFLSFFGDVSQNEAALANVKYQEFTSESGSPKIYGLGTLDGYPLSAFTFELVNYLLEDETVSRKLSSELFPDLTANQIEGLLALLNLLVLSLDTREVPLQESISSVD